MAGANILKTVITDNPTKEQLSQWIEWHKNQCDRYSKLDRYYKGEHSINSRELKIKSNANNKTMINWCSFITNTLTGYFLSLPIDYKTEEQEVLEYVKKINRENVSDDEDYELAKMASIFGHAFEILYYDKDSNIKFNKCSPLNTFLLYDVNELEEVPKAGIRYQKNTDPNTGKEITIAQYYTEKEVVNYKLDSTYNIKNEDRKQHYYSSLPIVEYLNNNERIGDFEEIITLQDAYNVIMSDRTNNVENVVNSLLVIINYMPPETNEKMQNLIKELKDNGLIFIDKEGDIKYISNPIDGATVENLRKNIKEDILEIAACPDMTDDKFSGNTSGIAMKYKLWTTEQKTGAKEKKFRKGIYNRLRLISDSPKTKPFNWQDIDLVFTRNIPVNHVEKLESASKIYGTISEQTYLEYIGPSIGIEDIRMEMERLDKEKEKQVEQYFPKEEEQKVE